MGSDAINKCIGHVKVARILGHFEDYGITRDLTIEDRFPNPQHFLWHIGSVTDVGFLEVETVHNSDHVQDEIVPSLNLSDGPN